ncbi:GNAT family N-acetyltransferase [Candidatus Viridilinea mediisalina]|uniref:GNAT family N-acetyltransferase n=1 Tax=Candidatus Viridilinea mediisalina TaxID=2024553 RepID=A0A2A6RP86_9CHLR|nr:GNAT family N-acetyltransferase [Candidatus Viridilinea mediisalina]PDW04872.1 GNAT family N-acetyltransferase [Candidatus Viridilinea mediisalina]
MQRHTQARIIYGQRVLLRPWQRSDNLAQELWPRYYEPLHTLWNIPRISLYDEFGGRGWQAQRYVWAVDNLQQRLIGRISLREVETDGTCARLGISLSQAHVGQGLGTEALALFLDHYFGPLEFSSMYLDVAAFNRRAVRCYERLGFRYIESEWRSAGRDPALRQLNDPRHTELLTFFRRSRFETFVEFYEMLLTREAWLEQHRNNGVVR